MQFLCDKSEEFYLFKSTEFPSSAKSLWGKKYHSS